MSIEKNINVRIQHKCDIEANWYKAKNFIPKFGEIIVYMSETSTDALPPKRTYPITETRIKVGDGVNNVNDLDFIFSESIGAIFLALEKIHKIQNALIDSVESSGGDVAADLSNPIATYNGTDLDATNITTAVMFNGGDLDIGGIS